MFFALGLILMSGYTIKSFLLEDADTIEKSSELDENEKESENETESEEEDEKIEDFLRIHFPSTSLSFESNKDVFIHLEMQSMHFGDTFTPPPDQI
ncbi:MAG: hypothetical protein R2799_10940 [Crocinitomicaceae bacterium]